MKTSYPIQIGSKTYQFSFGIGACRKFEKTTGKLMYQLMGALSIDEWIQMFLAGMSLHPEVTPENVETIIDEAASFQKLKMDVNKAVAESLGIANQPAKTATDEDGSKKKD